MPLSDFFIRRRRNLPQTVAFALLAGLLTSFAPADDLAALARKEKARRAALEKRVKVLTEDDARDAAASGAGSLTTLAEKAPSTAGEQGAQMAVADRDALQAVWGQRAAAARAAVAAAEKKLEEMEKELATVRSDLTQVSAADAQDPLRLQKREARIVEMNGKIEIQKGAIAEARKAISTLEDEARRSGVPPGWLR